MIFFDNIGALVTMAPEHCACEPANRDIPLGTIRRAALLVNDQGKILWLGPREGAPQGLSCRCVDLKDALVLPGFVDCHTHLVFAGDRAADFDLRSQGRTYEQIAAAGGGIQTTVKATRAASEQCLYDHAKVRLDSLLAHGVTAVEVKSGYGLDWETEKKILHVIRELKRNHPVQVSATFLGAHAIPTAFGVGRAEYVDDVVLRMIPQVARLGLAEFCDVFCEESAFRLDEAKRILEAARHAGLVPKIHAEQLSHQGAAAMAAALGAISADHLEFLAADDLPVLAEHGTVAVLLPGASLLLGAKRWAPARSLLAAGIPVALSTDCNPGTSPTVHLPLMTSLACACLGMTPTEALAAITCHAARAIGRAGQVGILAPGCAADFVVLDSASPLHLVYELGRNPVLQVFISGKLVYAADSPSKVG